MAGTSKCVKFTFPKRLGEISGRVPADLWREDRVFVPATHGLSLDVMRSRCKLSDYVVRQQLREIAEKMEDGSWLRWCAARSVPTACGIS